MNQAQFILLLIANPFFPPLICVILELFCVLPLLCISAFPISSSDLFESLSELIILTASRCLHGVEIRSVLTESVAQLYTDLDGGFTHAAWILPQWLPLPSFRYTSASSSALFIDGLSRLHILHCVLQTKQGWFRFHFFYIGLCCWQLAAFAPGYIVGVCKRGLPLFRSLYYTGSALLCLHRPGYRLH